MGRDDRGFTLIEVVIAVGIIAIIAIGAVGIALSARTTAVSTAALQFDALLDAARTTAREFSHGVTIAFEPDTYGDGFTARIYRNRPNAGPLVATTLPALNARVSLKESESLGAPAFALTIHANGAVAGIAGDVLGATPGPETACPPSGAYHLTFAYGGARADRYVPCRINLAATGPVAFATFAPATPAPTPTAAPCGGGSCTTIPTIPNVNPTCPPHYFAKDPATCINPPLIVAPRSLSFAAPQDPMSLAYTIQEDSYTGAFHASNDCNSGIIDQPTTGRDLGPTDVHTVSARTAGTQCTITVSDDRGSPVQTVSVGVLSTARLLLYVCDPQQPARPVNTDIGPDPDGIHEDYSNGASCSNLNALSGPTFVLWYGNTQQSTIIDNTQSCPNTGPNPQDPLVGGTYTGSPVSGQTNYCVYQHQSQTTVGSFIAAHYFFDPGGEPIYGPPPQCDPQDPNPAVDCPPPIIGYQQAQWYWWFSLYGGRPSAAAADPTVFVAPVDNGVFDGVHPSAYANSSVDLSGVLKLDPSLIVSEYEYYALAHTFQDCPPCSTGG